MKIGERDRTRLQEMLRLSQEIQKERTLLLSVKEFAIPTMQARAIMFDFIQLGELASRMSSDFLASFPNFPINKIKGFRNVLAHDYNSLDPKMMERTLYSDIDDLTALLLFCLR